jgi:DNA-binding NarL/FixJ family response regulator
MVNVLLVDDQVLFVENLKIVIDTQAPDLDVVGVAYSGAAALQKVKEHRPDVVLLDVRMPGMSGVEVTELILDSSPETKVLMLTTFDDDDYVFQSIERGASGYLLKNMDPQRLFSSIRAVMDGSVLVSPSVAQKLFVRSQGHETDELTNQPRPWLSELNRRERRVLKKLVAGLSNREIAEALYLSEKTVKNYVSSIYTKIGAPDRFAAMRIAKAAVEFLNEHADE